MKVHELIEMLECYDNNDEVLIESQHYLYHIDDVENRATGDLVGSSKVIIIEGAQAHD